MKIQKYYTCEGVICEYKNCKKEVTYIKMTSDTEEAYYNGKLRCKRHKNI